jgi:hypothetical protein
MSDLGLAMMAMKPLRKSERNQQTAKQSSNKTHIQFTCSYIKWEIVHHRYDTTRPDSNPMGRHSGSMQPFGKTSQALNRWNKHKPDLPEGDDLCSELKLCDG